MPKTPALRKLMEDLCEMYEDNPEDCQATMEVVKALACDRVPDPWTIKKLDSKTFLKKLQQAVNLLREDPDAVIDTLNDIQADRCGLPGEITRFPKEGTLPESLLTIDDSPVPEKRRRYSAESELS